MINNKIKIILFSFLFFLPFLVFAQSSENLRQTISIKNAMRIEKNNAPIPLVNLQKNSPHRFAGEIKLFFDTIVYQTNPVLVLDQPKSVNRPALIVAGLDEQNRIKSSTNSGGVYFYYSEDSDSMKYAISKDKMTELVFENNLISSYALPWGKPLSLDYSMSKEEIELAHQKRYRQRVVVSYNKEERPDTLKIFREYGVIGLDEIIKLDSSKLAIVRVIDYNPKHESSTVTTATYIEFLEPISKPYTTKYTITTSGNTRTDLIEKENEETYIKSVFEKFNRNLLERRIGYPDGKRYIVEKYKYKNYKLIQKEDTEFSFGKFVIKRITKYGQGFITAKIAGETKNRNSVWGILSIKVYDENGAFVKEGTPPLGSKLRKVYAE